MAKAPRRELEQKQNNGMWSYWDGSRYVGGYASRDAARAARTGKPAPAKRSRKAQDVQVPVAENTSVANEENDCTTEASTVSLDAATETAAAPAANITKGTRTMKTITLTRQSVTKHGDARYSVPGQIRTLLVGKSFFADGEAPETIEITAANISEGDPKRIEKQAEREAKRAERQAKAQERAAKAQERAQKAVERAQKAQELAAKIAAKAGGTTAPVAEEVEAEEVTA